MISHGNSALLSKLNMNFDQQRLLWRGIWSLADVSSVKPFAEQQSSLL